MVELNFDANTVEPQGTYELIPEGWYKAIISASEKRVTKSGTGAYTSLRFTLLDNPVEGRTLFTNLNLQNPNEKAEEIAFKQLSAICHSVHTMQIVDAFNPVELYNKPLQIRVKVKPAQGQYEAQNEVRGYKSIDGASPAVSTSATGGDTSDNDTPPWMDEA